MYAPAWVQYGGQAWLPAIGREVVLPDRVWPVVDVQDDNLGKGLIVSILGTFEPGLDAVIADADLFGYAGDRFYEGPADDRPWGEQQAQVDWLESRFDHLDPPEPPEPGDDWSPEEDES